MRGGGLLIPGPDDKYIQTGYPSASNAITRPLLQLLNNFRAQLNTLVINDVIINGVSTCRSLVKLRIYPALEREARPN